MENIINLTPRTKSYLNGKLIHGNLLNSTIKKYASLPRKDTLLLIYDIALKNTLINKILYFNTKRIIILEEVSLNNNIPCYGCSFLIDSNKTKEVITRYKHKGDLFLGVIDSSTEFAGFQFPSNWRFSYEKYLLWRKEKYGEKVFTTCNIYNYINQKINNGILKSTNYELKIGGSEKWGYYNLLTFDLYSKKDNSYIDVQNLSESFFKENNIDKNKLIQSIIDKYLEYKENIYINADPSIIQYINKLR